MAKEKHQKRDICFGFLLPPEKLLLAAAAVFKEEEKKEYGDNITERRKKKRIDIRHSQWPQENSARRWHYGVESAYNSCAQVR
jgi:hypothetical protein